jgi:hypothetical protein
MKTKTNNITTPSTVIETNRRKTTRSTTIDKQSVELEWRPLSGAGVGTSREGREKHKTSTGAKLWAGKR